MNTIKGMYGQKFIELKKDNVSSPMSEATIFLKLKNMLNFRLNIISSASR